MIKDLVCNGEVSSDLVFVGTVVSIYVSEYFLGKTKGTNSTIQLIFNLFKLFITKMGTKKE